MKNRAREELLFIVNMIASQTKARATSLDASLLSDLHRTAGVMQASALQFQKGTIGNAMSDCFDAAFMAGVPLASFTWLRETIEEFSPKTFQGVVSQLAAIAFSLTEEARCIAASTLTTRSEAQTTMATIGAAFDRAEEYASDIGDTDVYKSLISLHAATTRDLIRRSSTLPETVVYSLPQSASSLHLANRLYGDATRAEELERENATPHPAFMPARGIALTR